MKAKELTAFLKKYALDSPAQEPDASKQESAEKPDSDAEDSEDPKGKAVPQAGPVSQDTLAGSTHNDHLRRAPSAVLCSGLQLQYSNMTDRVFSCGCRGRLENTLAIVQQLTSVR